MSSSRSGNRPAKDINLSKISNTIDKDLRAAIKASDTLQSLFDKMKTPRITAGMGTIPRAVYEQNAFEQSDICNQLPPEIQRLVWSYLVHQPDRIALALVCKLQARMHEELKPSYLKISIKYPKKEHRVAVLQRLSTWMTPKYRLCVECVRYHKDQARTRAEWSGDSALIRAPVLKGGRIESDILIGGPKCPNCSFRNGVSHLKDIENLKELQRRIEKHYGPLKH